MSFHEIRFPVEVSRGATSGPSFQTSIITTDSGGEQRTPRWAAGKWKGDARKGVKTIQQCREVLDFYRARLGPAHGFRYKDWIDYATNPTGHLWLQGDAVVTKNDVQLGVGDGSQTIFQLIKRYTSGPTTIVRNLTKPVSGTVLVALDGTLQTETTHYTVNYATGVITFNTAPGVGVVVTAGCEFDVPVRFGSEIDIEGLLVSIDDFSVGSLPSIPLIEIIDGLENPEDFFFGGGKHIVLSANQSITLQDGMALTIDPQSAGLKLILPSESTGATNLPAGGPYWYISNVSGSQSLEIREGTAAGAVVGTIAAGAAKVVVLGFTAGGAKKWYLL